MCKSQGAMYDGRWAMGDFTFRSGERGIRTPGPARRDNRFRVCRIRPLCHLSEVGVSVGVQVKCGQ